MAQYVARFIPDFASRTEALRRLTRKDVPWEWTQQEHEEAFDNIKDALTSTQVMACFNPAEQTDVLVDASLVGVGAILAQEGKIIAYSSRALTDVEQRYSQTDRKMLAVVFGVEHFHLYLYGSNFTVYTDHKPLLGIYKSQKSATARIERWRLRLNPYDMTLKYRPGRNDLNPADYVSRQPQDIPKRENAAEAYVNYVCKNAVPKSMTLEEVRKETQKDSMMKKPAKATQRDQWTKDLTDYV